MPTNVYPLCSAIPQLYPNILSPLLLTAWWQRGGVWMGWWSCMCHAAPFISTGPANPTEFCPMNTEQRGRAYTAPPLHSNTSSLRSCSEEEQGSHSSYRGDFSNNYTVTSEKCFSWDNPQSTQYWDFCFMNKFLPPLVTLGGCAYTTLHLFNIITEDVGVKICR